jgi:hypothetical protein
MAKKHRETKMISISRFTNWFFLLLLCSAPMMAMDRLTNLTIEEIEAAIAKKKNRRTLVKPGHACNECRRTHGKCSNSTPCLRCKNHKGKCVRRPAAPVTFIFKNESEKIQSYYERASECTEKDLSDIESENAGETYDDSYSDQYSKSETSSSHRERETKFDSSFNDSETHSSAETLVNTSVSSSFSQEFLHNVEPINPNSFGHILAEESIADTINHDDHQNWKNYAQYYYLTNEYPSYSHDSSPRPNCDSK